MTREEAKQMIKSMGKYLSEGNPIWDVEPVKEATRMAIEALSAPTGEWKEKEVFSNDDNTIEEWQSAKCSNCGLYHTTPYMYYFSNYKFCPNCGAQMLKGGDNK